MKKLLTLKYTVYKTGFAISFYFAKVLKLERNSAYSYRRNTIRRKRRKTPWDCPTTEITIYPCQYTEYTHRGNLIDSPIPDCGGQEVSTPFWFMKVVSHSRSHIFYSSHVPNLGHFSSRNILEQKGLYSIWTGRNSLLLQPMISLNSKPKRKTL